MTDDDRALLRLASLLLRASAESEMLACTVSGKPWACDDCPARKDKYTPCEPRVGSELRADCADKLLAMADG